MADQQFDGSEVNHFLGGFLSLLIISGESAESVEPCERPLDHPAERLRREAVDSVRGGADFDVDVQLVLYPVDQLAAVTAVHETFPDRWPGVVDLCAERLSKMGVVCRRAAHHAAEYKAVAVDGDVPLDALYFLVGVKSIGCQPVAPLDALGVKSHHRRSGTLSAFASDLHDEMPDAVLNAPGVAPAPEIPVYRVPSRKVMRKHPPLAAADQKIQHGLEHGAKGIFAASVIIFKEYFVYIGPLALGQMCLIEEFFMHDNISFSPFNTLAEGFSCP